MTILMYLKVDRCISHKNHQLFGILIRKMLSASVADTWLCCGNVRVCECARFVSHARAVVGSLLYSSNVRAAIGRLYDGISYRK